MTSSKDRRANETTVEYDAAGRRTKATDPLGNFTEWTYDANGNVTKVKETEKIPGSSGTEAFETEFTYDVINRQTKRTEIDRTDSSNKKIGSSPSRMGSAPPRPPCSVASRDGHHEAVRGRAGHPAAVAGRLPIGTPISNTTVS